MSFVSARYALMGNNVKGFYDNCLNALLLGDSSRGLHSGVMMFTSGMLFITLFVIPSTLFAT